MAFPAFRAVSVEREPEQTYALLRTLERAIVKMTDSMVQLDATIRTLNDRLAPSEAAPVCSHPLDSRTDFSQMGKLGRFECSIAKGGCGFRNFN